MLWRTLRVIGRSKARLNSNLTMVARQGAGYSDRMLLALLASRRPERFHKPQVEGAAQGPMQIVISGGLPDSKFLTKPTFHLEKPVGNGQAAIKPADDDEPPDKPEP
jgi:hypothetical protein